MQNGLCPTLSTLPVAVESSASEGECHTTNKTCVEKNDTLGHGSLKHSHGCVIGASFVEGTPAHASKPLLRHYHYVVVPHFCYKGGFEKG